MQSETFRERCEGDAYANDVEIVAAGLPEAVRATCKRLRAEGFTPTIPADGSALAAHHWAHSWMDGFADSFQQDAERDVLMRDVLVPVLELSARSKATERPAEPHESRSSQQPQPPPLPQQ